MKTILNNHTRATNKTKLTPQRGTMSRLSPVPRRAPTRRFYRGHRILVDRKVPFRINRAGGGRGRDRTAWFRELGRGLLPVESESPPSVPGGAVSQAESHAYESLESCLVHLGGSINFGGILDGALVVSGPDKY